MLLQRTHRNNGGGTVGVKPLAFRSGCRSIETLKKAKAMRWLLIVIALLLGHPAQADDFEEGLKAYLFNNDYATALVKLRSAEQKGDARAQYVLGEMYDKGRGVLQDYKEAVRLYTLAARKGIPSAQNNLGWMYETGKGVEQNYKEAIYWYRLAAQQEYVQSLINLGEMYEIGRGNIQDYVRAHMWYNIAAINGDTDSRKKRDLIERKMTSKQIEEALRFARVCKASNFTKCD